MLVWTEVSRPNASAFRGSALATVSLFADRTTRLDSQHVMNVCVRDMLAERDYSGRGARLTQHCWQRLATGAKHGIRQGSVFCVEWSSSGNPTGPASQLARRRILLVKVTFWPPATNRAEWGSSTIVCQGRSARTPPSSLQRMR